MPDRHSSVKVTEGHYSHFVKRFCPADVTTLRPMGRRADQRPETHAAPGAGD